ncbi:hypothetical protein [Haloferula sargassicola]|uniref:Uncharacterized protein n=1 Tax=Haloferula sargassicola TaxID=490096 RepID=A0ABP9UIQ5_9BACT
MSREAVLKLSRLGKAPTDRNDLFRILDLAEKVLDGEQRLELPGGSDPPDNVIPFPLVCAAGG